MSKPNRTDLLIGLRAEALSYALIGNEHRNPDEITRRAKVFADFMETGTAPVGPNVAIVPTRKKAK